MGGGGRAELWQDMEQSFFRYHSEVCFNQRLLVFLVSPSLSSSQNVTAGGILQGHLAGIPQGWFPQPIRVLLVDGMQMTGETCGIFALYYVFYKIVFFPNLY